MSEYKKPVGLSFLGFLQLSIGTVSLLGVLLAFAGSTRPLRVWTNAYVWFEILATTLLFLSGAGLLRRSFFLGYVGSHLTALVLGGNLVVWKVLAPAFVSNTTYFFLAYLIALLLFLNFRYRKYFERK